MTHRFVPVAEAVSILGMSPTTIRRKIDAGELEAERIVRPQGTAFLVRVPALDAPQDAPGDEPPGAEDAPEAPIGGAIASSGTHQDAPSTNHDAPDLPSLLAAATGPLVRRLEAADVLLAANAEAFERQAGQLVGQAEMIGRISAERDAERARAEDLAVRLASTTAELERERRRTWWDRIRGR